jgi:hypothetical protein
MDGNYVFLCGVMWCRFGQHDAGKELLRAADSGDPESWKNGRNLVPARSLGENYVDEIMRCL